MEIVPAGIVLALVRVGLLGVDPLVVLDVLEGGVHQTTVTPLVAVPVEQGLRGELSKVGWSFSSLYRAILGAAVDEVLLGERGEDPGFPVGHRLQGPEEGGEMRD